MVWEILEQDIVLLPQVEPQGDKPGKSGGVVCLGRWGPVGCRPAGGVQNQQLYIRPEGVLWLGTCNKGHTSDFCYLTTEDEKCLPTLPDDLTPFKSSRIQKQTWGWTWGAPELTEIRLIKEKLTPVHLWKVKSVPTT